MTSIKQRLVNTVSEILVELIDDAEADGAFDTTDLVNETVEQLMTHQPGLVSEYARMLLHSFVADRAHREINRRRNLSLMGRRTVIDNTGNPEQLQKAVDELLRREKHPIWS